MKYDVKLLQNNETMHLECDRVLVRENATIFLDSVGIVLAIIPLSQVASITRIYTA